MRYRKLHGSRDQYEAFKALIIKVEPIDKDAAKFMRKDASHVKNFCYSGEIAGFVCWCDTPQGHQYWWDIETALKGNHE